MAKRANISETAFLRDLVMTLVRQNDAILAQSQKLIEAMTFGQGQPADDETDKGAKLRKFENYIADVDGANHGEELGDTE